jgi:hypothetical protein
MNFMACCAPAKRLFGLRQTQRTVMSLDELERKALSNGLAI